MTAYVAAKRRIVAFQGADDLALLGPGVPFTGPAAPCASRAIRPPRWPTSSDRRRGRARSRAAAPVPRLAGPPGIRVVDDSMAATPAKAAFGVARLARELGSIERVVLLAGRPRRRRAPRAGGGAGAGAGLRARSRGARVVAFGEAAPRIVAELPDATVVRRPRRRRRRRAGAGGAGRRPAAGADVPARDGRPGAVQLPAVVARRRVRVDLPLGGERQHRLEALGRRVVGRRARVAERRLAGAIAVDVVLLVEVAVPGVLAADTGRQELVGPVLHVARLEPARAGAAAGQQLDAARRSRPGRGRRAGRDPLPSTAGRAAAPVNEAARRPIASGGATSVAAGAVASAPVRPAACSAVAASAAAPRSRPPCRPPSPHAVTSTAARTRATTRRMRGAYRTPQARAVLGHGENPRASYARSATATCAAGGQWSAVP